MHRKHSKGIKENGTFRKFSSSNKIQRHYFPGYRMTHNALFFTGTGSKQAFETKESSTSSHLTSPILSRYNPANLNFFVPECEEEPLAVLGSQTVDAARVDCSSEVVVHLVIVVIMIMITVIIIT